MAKILYSLCGVGMGHAIRSKVIIDHLRKKHKVLIIASHRVYNYLKQYYKEIHKIEGLELVFRDNRIVSSHTVLRNLKKVNPDTVDNLELAKRRIDKFDPDMVVSDWETFSMYIAKSKKIPLLVIDNEHYLSHGDYQYPRKYALEWLKTKTVARLITRRADRYLVTLFPGTKLKKGSKAKGILPILRKDLLNSKPRKGKKILVYQWTANPTKLSKILQQVDQEFVIYGFNIEKKYKNLEFKKFDDKKGFVKDLVNCKAVLTSAGFTLISEAVYLQKAILCTPVKKHFEQILNALYVKENKYGEMYQNLTVERLNHFIQNVEKNKYRKAHKWDNSPIFKEVDRVIQEMLKK